MQIKTTIRYHLKPARMAIIKKSTNNKCRRGCREKGTLLFSVCKLEQSRWRMVWKSLKKLELDLPYNPAIPLLGMYPEKDMIRKETCTPCVTAASFTAAKNWKQPKCPSTEEWIKKMWYLFTMEYPSAIKNKEIMPFVATLNNLESILQSKLSQTEKEKYCRTSFTHGILKKKKTKTQMNLITKQKETHRLREWIYGCLWERDS